MSHMYHEEEMTPRQVLEMRSEIEAADTRVDNTTEDGREFVRRFLAQSEPGRVWYIRSKRLLREIGAVGADETADRTDAQQVGAVFGCIASGDIRDERLAAVDVERWGDSGWATWRIVVPEAWPEVVDDE